MVPARNAATAQSTLLPRATFAEKSAKIRGATQLLSTNPGCDIIFTRNCLIRTSEHMIVAENV
jgi:hypothetical protein